MARFLPQEHRVSVYRSVVLSVVLTLAGVQNATALCAAWCDPAGMVASPCRHEGAAASTSVSGASHCGDAQALLSAVGADSWRTITAPSFIALSGKSLAHPSAVGDRAALPARGSPFHGTCHLIALRI